MSEKVAKQSKPVEFDVNKLWKVQMGAITLKKIKYHLNQCESCGMGGWHVWRVQMGVKSIGTICFCPKCHEHTQWGKKLVKKDINALIAPFQVWIDKNL